MPDRLRFIKLTNRSRLADRYLTVQVKESPDSVIDQGKIFSIIEIEAANSSSFKIGQIIINNLARAYFRGEAKKPEENFELALKQVNETLRLASQSGESDWLESLNAVLVLLVKNQLYLTGVGRNYGWLIRDNKSSEIFEKSWPKATTNKAFSAVLSGSLEAGDKLIFASSGLLEITTKKEFRSNILEQPTAAMMANNFAEIIKLKNGQWVNALILDLESEETISNRPLESIPETVFLDSSGAAKFGVVANRIWRGTQRALVNFGSQTKKATSHTKEKLKDEIIPSSKKNLQETKNWSNKQITKLQKTALPKIKAGSSTLIEKVKAAISKKEMADASSKSKAKTGQVDTPEQGLIGQAVYAIRDYSQEAVDQTTTKIKSYHEKKPRLNLENFYQKINKSNWRPWTYAALALMLIVIFGTSLRTISNQRSSEADLAAQNAELSRLEDLLEEAKLARIFNQPDKAATTLDEIITSLNALNTPEIEESASELLSLAQEELDQLTNTTRLKDFTEMGSLAGAKTLAGNAANLFLAGTQNIAALNQDKIKTLGEVNNEIIDLALFDEKPIGLALTNRPELIEINDKLNTLTIEPKPSIAIATFFNSIYGLSPTTNQIWKYGALGDEFSDPAEYVVDGTSLNEAIDLAVDGDIFVLNSNGTVFKFTSGRKQNFEITEIPNPNNTILEPKSIQTTKDGSFIYILDGERIIKLNKDGRFSKQYALNLASPIDSLVIDESQNLIFILSQNKLYRAEL